MADTPPELTIDEIKAQLKDAETRADAAEAKLKAAAEENKGKTKLTKAPTGFVLIEIIKGPTAGIVIAVKPAIAKVYIDRKKAKKA